MTVLPGSLADSQEQAGAHPVRVSVALCTYNGAAFLPEQLESIAAQTLMPCELVVCDDRSTDGTIALLEEFAKTAGFAVRIEVNAEQLGPGQNFAKALRLCTGEFIALCDQDDRWDRSKLERLTGMLLAEPEAGGVFSDAGLLDGGSKILAGSLWERFRFQGRVQEMFRQDPVRILLKHDVVTGATMVIRASVLKTFTEVGASWLHDGWLVWMIVLSGRILMMPERLTYYRLHAAQQVGAGGRTYKARWLTIQRETRRSRETMVEKAGQMVRYIEENRPEKATVAESWRRKRAFLLKRTELSAWPGPKLWFMVRHMDDYRRYDRGWRSMFNDLVAG